MDLLRFFNTQRDFVETCVVNSLELVIISIIISLLIWIPIGVLISKNKRASNIVLAIANSIFCIPSLALFSIMITIPFLGLGRKSAVIALVLYSMMPMLKSVYFGLTSIDSNIIEAAKGMGMNDFQILKEVRFPLALNRIFSGFRVSFIMLIGISTIATYIGEKNIGRIISSGLARQDMEMIVAGTLLISILSLFMDFLLEFIEKNIIRRY